MILSVHSRVLEMFNDIEENGCSNNLQNSYFAFLADKSAGITNKVQLLAFIHFILKGVYQDLFHQWCILLKILYHL